MIKQSKLNNMIRNDVINTKLSNIFDKFTKKLEIKEQELNSLKNK
jgi:hypothetical protein